MSCNWSNNQKLFRRNDFVNRAQTLSYLRLERPRVASFEAISFIRDTKGEGSVQEDNEKRNHLQFSHGSVKSIHTFSLLQAIMLQSITTCHLMILFLNIIYLLKGISLHEEGWKWCFHASLASLAFIVLPHRLWWEYYCGLEFFPMKMLIKEFK